MGDWVQVADLDSIGPGGLYVWVGNEEVLLVRDGEEVHAIAYLCSHQDMELEGGHQEGDAWVCPHHGARFKLATGEALTMPAIEPIPVFEARVEDGKVFVKEPGS